MGKLLFYSKGSVQWLHKISDLQTWKEEFGRRIKGRDFMKSNKVNSIPRDAVTDKKMFKTEKVLLYIPAGDASSAWLISLLFKFRVEFAIARSLSGDN